MNSFSNSHTIKRSNGCKCSHSVANFKCELPITTSQSLPGIPPTNKYLEIPFTAVVCIRGDRLYHEHIAWDQATVLKQLDLLPEYLPFPYPLPHNKLPASGKRFEYKLPVANVSCAEKMRDKNKVVSNEMFEYSIRETNI